MEQNLNILGTQNAFKGVLANRVNSLFITFYFFIIKLSPEMLKMVAFISLPLKCMHVMPLTMHFASSCQHLNSDVKYKA